MTQPNFTLKQLVKIYNAFNGDRTTVAQWQDAFDLYDHRDARLARYLWQDEIVPMLNQTNYTGDRNNFNQIINFARAYYRPIREEQKRLERRWSDTVLLEYRLPYLIPEDPFDAIDKKLSQFHQRPRNYAEWRQQQNELNDGQAELVEATMQRLYDNPTDWFVDFEQFTLRGRKLLFPRLRQFFDEAIRPLQEDMNRFVLLFQVNNTMQPKAIPLTPEHLQELVRKLTEESFVYQIDDEISPDIVSDPGPDDLIASWSIFTRVGIVPIRYQGEMKKNKEPGFFHYLTTPDTPKIIVEYLKRLQIFDSVVVATKGNKQVQRKELDDCCFVYALKQTGCYTEAELDKIRMRIKSRYLSQKHLEAIANEFKMHLHITYIDDEYVGRNKKQTVKVMTDGKYKSYIGVENAAPNRTHNMCINGQHFFIEEVTPFSNYYIKHLREIANSDNEEAKENMYNKEIKDKKVIPGRTFIKASNLVRELMKQGFFQHINWGQYMILNTIYYKEIEKDMNEISLEYNPEFCTQLIEPKVYKKQKDKAPPSYWYADFEADVSGDIHVPFMCVVQDMKGTEKYSRVFNGRDCNVQMLNYLPDGAVVYFHNLAYDIRMFAGFGITSSIIKGTKTMKAKIIYKGKKITFKDSYPVIPSKLSDFPKMFGIKGVKKELFPYKYYTLERLESGAIGIISEAGMNEDRVWKEDDYKIFNENIDSIEGCRKGENEFDMWLYCSFYCKQDVNILRQGFNKFRNDFKKEFNIDPFEFVSISSLANEVFNRRVYYPNKNLYKVGGIVRKFCSQAVYGGRCMTAYNKKWHTTKPLSDFDAVSLYPSAMAECYTVEGLPEVIPEDKLNMEFLSRQGAYIVEIRITKVNKHYAFPLIVRKTPDGLNLNEDKLEPDENLTMVVDNIMLEDLIEFQKIEFEFVRGYYWAGKRDYSIQKVIKEIFNKRLEYKQQGNPLQNIYKLIMNSCYGKTIQKPIEFEHRYVREGDDFDKFWMRHYTSIIEATKLNNSDIYDIKVRKPIDKDFNFSLLGIQILSMSKRIMNRVMCLAYDIGCHIYYQDTDSMHIEVEDLSRLTAAFKEKYGRELIGSQLGQFHSDFPTINGHDEIPKAVESMFLMKKLYIDKLTDSTGQVDYMIRGKGLTWNSIKHACETKFGGDYMALYKHMYEGNEQTFDLTKGQPCFKMNADFTVSTVKAFLRKTKTIYQEGNRDEYFHYAAI